MIDWEEHHRTRDSLFPDLDLIRYLSKEKVDPKKYVVEIGAGQGCNLEGLNRMGIKTLGIETSFEAIKKADSKGILVVPGGIESLKNLQCISYLVDMSCLNYCSQEYLFSSLKKVIVPLLIDNEAKLITKSFTCNRVITQTPELDFYEMDYIFSKAGLKESKKDTVYTCRSYHDKNIEEVFSVWQPE